MDGNEVRLRRPQEFCHYAACQSLRHGCAVPKGSPWHQGELSAKLTEGFFDPSVTATPCHRSTVQHGRLAAFAPHCASLARCSVAAHCASLRVLATPALRASAVRKAHLRCSLFHWGLRTGLRFAGPVFRGCGRPLGVSSPLHPFGASTATACFRHWRRPSCAPFSFGKKEAFGRATSYDCATNQKAPLDSKGAHEARALCAEQREVSPVRQGASQASPASEEKRLCRTVECCRRQPTESRVRSSWDCPSGHCLSIVQLWQ